MVVIDELIAILGYKVEGTEEVKKFQDGLDGVEQSAQKSSGSIRKIGLAAGATAAAAAGLTYKAVTDFAAFERELSRIGITAGASAVETAAASDVVQRLAKDFALPIDQAVAGLDTLVSSGMSLEQAMSFLPSVLATAQASGAAAQDIANTAIKAASALKIEAGQMQSAFDVMVAGGKAGQFELKDMAAYIPELANSFASLGYSGEDGLKRLIALLQTMREDTGSAATAAVQAQNVFGKILAPQTISAFDKQFGIDLPARLKEATSKGEDIIEAFVRISREALGGDMSLLPQLFTDQEFRLGMQSLITSEESFKSFMAAVNGAEVEGGVFRDLNRILGGTQAQIDRLTTSWDRFMNSLGSAASGPVGGGLDFLSNDLDFGEAVRKKLEAEGMSYWEREGWIFKNTFNREDMAKKAREGGYVPAGDDQARIDAKETPYAYGVLGRRPNRPVSQTPVAAPATAPASPSSPTPPAIDQSWFDRLTSSLSTMLGGQGASEAVVNDNRQDNRQFPVSVQAPVTVNVQQATQAPAAVGSAVAGAVQQGVQAVPSRMQSGLSPQ